MRANWRLLLATVLLFQVPAFSAELGSIQGQVLLIGPSPLAGAPPLLKKDDPAAVKAGCTTRDVPNDKLIVDSKSAGIAKVIVYLRKAPANMPAELKKPPAEPLTFDQLGCRFEPRVLSVRVGQTVNCVSQDSVAHNVHTNGFSNPSENFLIPPGSKVPTPVQLKEPESLPMRVNCDLHSWMSAYWVVTDHPYVAITNERGEFSISDLPPGDHTFSLWHEVGGFIPGRKTFKVTVEPGAQTLPPIKVPAAHFEAALKKAG
jgi:plastocyanin